MLPPLFRSLRQLTLDLLAHRFDRVRLAHFAASGASQTRTPTGRTTGSADRHAREDLRTKRRQPPSRWVSADIDALVGGDGADAPRLANHLVRLGIQHLAQEALEEEAADVLGRGHYERRPAGAPHRGYRNGYREETLATAYGPVTLAVPQLRATPVPHRSILLGFMRDNVELLERLAIGMVGRGLSPDGLETGLVEKGGEPAEAPWGEPDASPGRDPASVHLSWLSFGDGRGSAGGQADLEEGILVAAATLAVGFAADESPGRCAARASSLRDRCPLPFARPVEGLPVSTPRRSALPDLLRASRSPVRAFHRQRRRATTSSAARTWNGCQGLVRPAGRRADERRTGARSAAPEGRTFLFRRCGPEPGGTASGTERARRAA